MSKIGNKKISIDLKSNEKEFNPSVELSSLLVNRGLNVVYKDSLVDSIGKRLQKKEPEDFLRNSQVEIKGDLKNQYQYYKCGSESFCYRQISYVSFQLFDTKKGDILFSHSEVKREEIRGLSHTYFLDYKNNYDEEFRKQVINEIYDTLANQDKVFRIPVITRLEDNRFGNELSIALESESWESTLSSYRQLKVNLNKEDRSAVELNESAILILLGKFSEAEELINKIRTIRYYKVQLEILNIIDKLKVKNA
ncbi:hypothetical protein ABMA77_08800 [Halobacteriovorax sp. RZ-1]|uniref:hypothetical protein n=1 Tax=unclassified Halobacteriovorax TaxID=2639665 RepID=UPI00371B9930